MLLSSGRQDVGSEEDGYFKGMDEGARIFFFMMGPRTGGVVTVTQSTPQLATLAVQIRKCSMTLARLIIPSTVSITLTAIGRFMEIGNNVFMA